VFRIIFFCFAPASRIREMVKNKKLQLNHKRKEFGCGNQRCVSFSHLYVGSNQENMMDYISDNKVKKRKNH